LSIEIPDWANIESETKEIKCPKCNAWCAEKENLMVCKVCNFKTHYDKLERYWIKQQKKEMRKKMLRAKGLTETDTYFCTLCRVTHIAGTATGFMHLEHAGIKRRLRVCSIPKCKVLLTGKQKKYGCGKDCETFYEHENTCWKCGYYFGQKGDGYKSKRLCFGCERKSHGAVLEDWDIFGLNATDSWEDVQKAFRSLLFSRKVTQEHKESYERLMEYYTGDTKDS